MVVYCLFTIVPSGNYCFSLFEESNPSTHVTTFRVGSLLIPRLGPEEIFIARSILQSIGCMVRRILYIRITRPLFAVTGRLCSSTVSLKLFPCPHLRIELANSFSYFEIERNIELMIEYLCNIITVIYRIIKNKRHLIFWNFCK